jgi:hypothetical protein
MFFRECFGAAPKDRLIDRTPSQHFEVARVLFAHDSQARKPDTLQGVWHRQVVISLQRQRRLPARVAAEELICPFPDLTDDDNTPYTRRAFSRKMVLKFLSNRFHKQYFHDFSFDSLFN